jgi:hypothetical protein
MRRVRLFLCLAERVHLFKLSPPPYKSLLSAKFRDTIFGRAGFETKNLVLTPDIQSRFGFHISHKIFIFSLSSFLIFNDSGQHVLALTEALLGGGISRTTQNDGIGSCYTFWYTMGQTRSIREHYLVRKDERLDEHQTNPA